MWTIGLPHLSGLPHLPGVPTSMSIFIPVELKLKRGKWRASVNYVIKLYALIGLISSSASESTPMNVWADAISVSFFWIDSDSALHVNIIQWFDSAHVKYGVWKANRSSKSLNEKLRCLVIGVQYLFYHSVIVFELLFVCFLISYLGPLHGSFEKLLFRW